MTRENMVKRGLKLLAWFTGINLILMIYFNSIGKGHVYNTVSFIQFLIYMVLVLMMMKEEANEPGMFTR